MEIRDNFSIFNLFLDKKVKITINDKSFFIRVPSVKEFCLDETINAVFHIWTLSEEKRQKLIPMQANSSFEMVTVILFQLAVYKEYSEIAKQFTNALKFFIPNVEINKKEKEIIVGDVILTTEI